MRLSGEVVTTSHYQSAGPSWIPDKAHSSPSCSSSRHSSPSCSSSQTNWLINGYLGKPGEGKLWKVRYHSGPVSRRNGLITTTGSKANVTGDERTHLHTATACVYTLLNQTEHMFVFLTGYIKLHWFSIFFKCIVTENWLVDCIYFQKSDYIFL